MLVALMGGRAGMTEEIEMVVGVVTVLLTAVLVVVLGLMRWRGGNGESEAGGSLGGGVMGDNSGKKGEVQSQRRAITAEISPSRCLVVSVTSWWAVGGGGMEASPHGGGQRILVLFHPKGQLVGAWGPSWESLDSRTTWRQ